MRRPPIILIGMHRSGTSLLTRMLGRLGLFTGARTDPNGEATFFQRQNDWILKRAGATWDNPRPAALLLSRRDLGDACLRRVESRIRSLHLWTYLGVAGALKHRFALDSDFAWGWKDPCNTYTLPLWLRLYPDAKVVHIRRHGVDVAQSLVARETEKAAADAAAFIRRRVVDSLRDRPHRVAPSQRCSTLQGAFSLWEEYLAEARRHVTERASNAIDLSYEELLAAPRDHLQKLAGFCDLPVDSDTLGQAASLVSPSRMRAFRRDESLMAFARTVASRLQEHGY